MRICDSSETCLPPLCKQIIEKLDITRVARPVQPCPVPRLRCRQRRNAVARRRTRALSAVIGPFDLLRLRAADASAALISLAAFISVTSWCGSHDMIVVKTAGAVTRDRFLVNTFY